MKKLMTKTLSLVALAVVAGLSVKAQSTATATLNVVLNNAASIIINGSNNVATLTYSTPANYANGVTLTQSAALTTISNQAYSVTVVADGALTNGANTIPVSDVTVTPTANGTPAGVTSTAQPIPTGTAATIITSTGGTVTQNFDLKYSTASSTDFIGKPAGTYTSHLTYTITNP